MHLSIKSLEKMCAFTPCFGTEEPLQTCGPDLKTKLHDPFEPFLASYHPLVVNQVSEITFINYLIPIQKAALPLGWFLKILRKTKKKDVFNLVGPLKTEKFLRPLKTEKVLRAAEGGKFQNFLWNLGRFLKILRKRKKKRLFQFGGAAEVAEKFKIRI